MAEKLKITISFKKTSKDLELYEWLYDMEDRSHEIKKMLGKFKPKKEKAPDS